MDLRRLSPALEESLDRQRAEAHTEADRADYTGVKARFSLAFGEQALGAIVEEFIRKTEPAEVLTATVSIMSHLIATVLVNVSDDESIVCATAKLLHDKLHLDFRKMQDGATAGARIVQDAPNAPIVVTTVGTPS